MLTGTWHASESILNIKNKMGIISRIKVGFVGDIDQW
jgi:hypothetical protein